MPRAGVDNQSAECRQPAHEAPHLYSPRRWPTPLPMVAVVLRRGESRYFEHQADLLRGAAPDADVAIEANRPCDRPMYWLAVAQADLVAAEKCRENEPIQPI